MGRIGEQLPQSVLDARLPVEAGVQVLGVEPGGVPALLQVVAQADGERRVFVVAVTDEQVLLDEGVFRRELMVAIFADVNAALLAEDDVL